MKPIIVPIAPEHIEGFHRALDVVSRERKYLAFLEAPPLESTRDFVLGLIEAGNPQFVALEGEVVVGWCDITRHQRPVFQHRGGLGMGLLPDYRGKGLGWALISTTLKAAKEAGFVRVELDVYTDNARAIALYEKAGFVREGIMRDAVCIDGYYKDMITMALINQHNKR